MLQKFLENEWNEVKQKYEEEKLKENKCFIKHTIAKDIRRI